jgi:hypothetical protein
MSDFYEPSTDKTTNHDWNSFYYESWQDFKKGFGITEFVDVDDSVKSYWKNEEDTVVFILDIPPKFDIMSLVAGFKHVYADELHYMKLTDTKYIVRLWWD